MYIYVHVYFQVLRFLCKPSFAMLCPPSPSSIEGFSFQKELPKKLFIVELLGKTYGEGYMEGLIIRSCQGRGSFINAFSNNLNTVNLFPNPTGIFT